MQRQMYIVQKCSTCFYFSIAPQNIVEYFLCALETAFHIFDLTFVRACMCVLACAAAVVRFDSDPIFFRTKFVNIHLLLFSIRRLLYSMNGDRSLVRPFSVFVKPYVMNIPIRFDGT